MKKDIQESSKLMNIIHGSSDWIDAFEKLEPYESVVTEESLHIAVCAHFFKSQCNVDADKKQYQEEM